MSFVVGLDITIVAIHMGYRTNFSLCSNGTTAVLEILSIKKTLLLYLGWRDGFEEQGQGSPDRTAGRIS